MKEADIKHTSSLCVTHIELNIILLRWHEMENLTHNVMTSAVFSFSCLRWSFYELPLFVKLIAFHWVWQNYCDARAYITQTVTSVSMQRKRQKKTDACFCGNDTEQLLSPLTYFLLRLWWLWAAQLHKNSCWSHLFFQVSVSARDSWQRAYWWKDLCFP